MSETKIKDFYAKIFEIIFFHCFYMSSFVKKNEKNFKIIHIKPMGLSNFERF